jgi:hypothetical protein
MAEEAGTFLRKKGYNPRIIRQREKKMLCPKRLRQKDSKDYLYVKAANERGKKKNNKQLRNLLLYNEKGSR